MEVWFRGILHYAPSLLNTHGAQMINVIAMFVLGGLPDNSEDQSLFSRELSSTGDSIGSVLKNRSMFGLSIDFF